MAKGIILSLLGALIFSSSCSTRTLNKEIKIPEHLIPQNPQFDWEFAVIKAVACLRQDIPSSLAVINEQAAKMKKAEQYDNCGIMFLLAAKIFLRAGLSQEVNFLLHEADQAFIKSGNDHKRFETRLRLVSLFIAQDVDLAQQHLDVCRQILTSTKLNLDYESTLAILDRSIQGLMEIREMAKQAKQEKKVRKKIVELKEN
jgi:hypothetical protein